MHRRRILCTLQLHLTAGRTSSFMHLLLHPLSMGPETSLVGSSASNHLCTYTVKTVDVEFRTYNRMTQDQTVNWAEYVSGLWAAKIQLNIRTFPLSSELSEDFSEFSGDFPKSISVEIKRWNAVGGDRTHVVRITDLVLYLPATAAICK